MKSIFIEKKERIFVFYTVEGGGGVEDAVAYTGCCVEGFTVKKAIARSKAAIHIRIRPKPKTMMSRAPISSSNPAVENRPTVVFDETSFSDFLMKKAAMIEKTQRIMKTTIAAETKGSMSPA